MFFRGWLSWLKSRSRSHHRARPRRASLLSPNGIGDWILEDRCLLGVISTTPVPVPPNSNTSLSQIFWNGGPPLNPNGVQGITAAPTYKTITITNTTGQTIYPILRDGNTGKDPHNDPTKGGGQKNPVGYYDPQDFNMQEFRAYLGYQGEHGQFLGLPAGATITIRVPVVFWDAENTYLGTDGTNLTPTSPGAANPFAYDPNAARGVSVLGDPNSWVVSFSDPAGDKGLVMFYHSTSPLTAAADAPAQLTEFTIRDPYLSNWLTDSAQTKVLFNYDVSYVDNLMAPIAMEAASVPVPIPPLVNPPHPDFGWVGASLLYGTPQQAGTMQNLVADFVNNAGPASVGTYFGGAGWPGYYNPDGVLKIPSGANFFANSPLNSVISSYSPFGPNNQYMLTSGGVAPIQIFAGGIVNSPDQTVFQLLFTSPQQRTTFFSNLQAMKQTAQTIDFYLKYAGQQTNGPLLGTLCTYNMHENTVSVVLSAGTKLTPGPVTVLFIRPVSDPEASAVTNLWYSWAQYYINQFQNFVPPPPLAGSIAANSSILTLNSPVPSTLAVGMTVSGSSGSGINPAPGTTVTILGFNPKNNQQIYLSQLSAGGSGSYTFDKPAMLPFADPTGINQITVTNGGSNYDPNGPPPMVNITGGSGSGASAVAIVSKTGQVTNVAITNAGHGYSAASPPMINFSGGGGSGAAAMVTGFGTTVTPFTMTFTADQQQTARLFAASVYEALAAEASILTYPAKSPLLPPSMSLIYTTIGCDTQDLPNSNTGDSLIGAQVRDLIKSILRGVYDFNAVPQSQWYPNPSTWEGGQHFNVYNLDPYVWFVHTVLGLSGYGFSVDDDTADVGAATSPYTPVDQQVLPNNLQIVFSGLGNLPEQKEWFGSVNWGTVTDTGTISNPTSGPNAGKTIVTLQTQEKYWQISPPGPALVGAYVSGQGIIPGTVVAAQGDVNSLVLILSNHAPDAQSVSITFSGKAPANPVQDSGFETPQLTAPPPNNYTHEPPTNTPWTFSNGSGIAENGSRYTALNGPAPEGTQVAFLKNQGAVSQQVTLLAGTYSLSFYAAQRQETPQVADQETLKVTVGNQQVASFKPSGTTYTLYNFSFTIPANGPPQYTITFAGTPPAGMDATALFDSVSVTAKLQ